VVSPLREPAAAPKQAHEGATGAWLELDPTRMRVDALEAVDGTPILDLKPVLDAARDG
jgi:tRNA (Thr-GGU) A37 N-methylase